MAVELIDPFDDPAAARALLSGAPHVTQPQAAAGQLVDPFDDPRFAQSLRSATPEQAGRLGKSRMSGLLENTVDSPEASAGVGATLKASLPATGAVDKRIAIYAKARGIDPSRYGVDRDGNIFFLDDNNKAVREVPSLAGSTGPMDFLRRLGANIGANAAPAAVSAGAALAGTAAGPGGASIPIAAGVGGLLDYGKQALGNTVAGDDAGRALTDVSLPSIAGEVALSGAGQTLPYLVNKAATRNPLRVQGYDDIQRLRDPAKMAGYQATDQNATRHGITLTPGEITDARSLRARERQLGRFDDTATAMGDFYRQRSTEQVPAAVGQTLDNLSNVPSDQGARNLQSAATGVQDAFRKKAGQVAGPMYDAAFDSGQQINLRPVLSVIDAAAKDAKGDILKTLKEAEGFLFRDYVKPDGTMGKTLDTSVRGAHNAKLAMDAMLERKMGDNAINRTARYHLQRVHEALTAQLDELPDYRAAKSTFGAIVAPTDDAKGGLIGQAARERPGGYQNVPETMFGKNAADPIAAARNRKLFEDAGKIDDWNAGLRSFLERRFQDAETKARGANPGANFYDSVFANERQRNTLKAAMSPQQWNAFDDLMKALEPLRRQAFEGSPTATDMGAKAAFEGGGSKAIGMAASAISPSTYFNIAERVHGWTQNISSAKQAQIIADIITKPGAVDQLKYLRVVGPGKTASAAVVGQVLARWGGSETRDALGLGPQERTPSVPDGF